jgi:ubiquinone/menaquinone biosynthesis C-methylase UbiE
MPERRSNYIHGTDGEEQARLTRLNEVLNAGTLRELALKPGEQILDVGAGLGQLSRAMARAVGRTGKVIGVERSAEQIAEAERQARAAGEALLVDLRRGDARDPPLTPAEWGTFDVAHARFVLEHVPDPEAVVAAMVRAVRPGGRVVLADDDHEVYRTWPEPPSFAAVWRAYCQSYRTAGNDPYVGRRLPELLHAAGASPRRCTWIFFGACAGDPAFPLLVENLATILAQAAAPLAKEGVTPGDLARATSEVRALSGRPGAALWYGMSYAEGVKLGAPARTP